MGMNKKTSWMLLTWLRDSPEQTQKMNLYPGGGTPVPPTWQAPSGFWCSSEDQAAEDEADRHAGECPRSRLEQSRPL
jgi:hypothetical protein